MIFSIIIGLLNHLTEGINNPYPHARPFLLGLITG